MKIATWNVNSVRARLPRLVPWLEEHRPDVLCLQETKVTDDLFPFEYLEDCGYNVAVHGQKTYNGVAILARHRIENVVKGFDDGRDDDEKRVISCSIDDLTIVDVYVPNGAAVGTDKYRNKLEWLARLRRFLDEHCDPRERVVVAGDFNVTFDDRDVWDPEAWREKILCSTPEREALAGVLAFGLHDALRRHHEEAGVYTWWDMRTAGFRRDQGLRIDHLLMTDAALESCSDVAVDRQARDGKAPSDHAPVVATFD